MQAADVIRSQITNDGLGELTGLTSLSYLGVRASQITDEGLNEYLPEMKVLSNLDLSYLDISDEALNGLSALSQLTKLNLEHTGISADGVVSLTETHWQNLKRLNVANTAINNNALAKFPEIFQPISLNVKDTAVTDAGIEYFSDLRELEYLVLSECDVSDDGVRILEYLDKLKRLNLRSTKVTDDCLVWLSSTNLERLELRNTNVTDAGMPTIADFPKLRSLDLTMTAVSNRGIRFFQEASHLDTLYLERSKVTGDGLHALKALPNLRALSVSPKDPGGDAMKSLLQLQTLQHLAIFDNTPVTGLLPGLRLLKSLLIVEPDETILKDLRVLQNLRWLLILTEQPNVELLNKYRDALPSCSIRFYLYENTARRDFRSLAEHC